VSDLSSDIVKAYDELPLWSAMFGLLLLEEVPFSNTKRVLDVGCGTGFPLIEIAERLGGDSEVHGIDPWAAALERAQEKIAIRGTRNAVVHEGTASALPFPDAHFDLIVSNLGVNNFDDRDAALAECRRVVRRGGTIALTTNLQGHMKEFYDVFSGLLDREGKRKLRDHVRHRATVKSIAALLSAHGFEASRVVKRKGVMRFASGSALLSHHFIKLGFVDAWRNVAPDDEVFRRLEERLNDVGELRLTVPMAYIEGVAV
jgi:arsenite methyltransferase